MTIGVGGGPCHLLAVIHHLHREVLVLTRIAGGDALIHGLGVDEKLEGGARLTHGRYLIVFPRIEVDVAHPGLHMAGLRLHSHKTTVHEVDHIANGVHCRHFFLDLTLVVVEDLHLMREVKIIVYGIQIAVEFLCKIFSKGPKSLLNAILSKLSNLQSVSAIIVAALGSPLSKANSPK